MSSVSLQVTRPTGRALLVGGVDCRQGPLGLLQDIGYICIEADDPYSAMVELSRRPQSYKAVILSLLSVYREELSLIVTVKHCFPQVEIWLTDTDGRQASLADAMRLGADGLLGNDGLHRVAHAAPAEAPNNSGVSKRNGKSGRSRRNRARRNATNPSSRPAEISVAVGASQDPSAMPRPVAPQTSQEQTLAARQEFAATGDEFSAASKDAGTAAYDDLDSSGEAVLSAEELRALLHEQPANEDGR